MRSGLGLGQLQINSGLDPAPAQQHSLFADPQTPALALPRLPDIDAQTRGRLELEILGLTVCEHPSALFPCYGEERAREMAAELPERISCGELHLHGARRVCLRGWVAASRRVRTEGGRWMRFVTIEDQQGMAEAVLFPDIYRRDGHRLTHRGPFLLSGVVENQLGARLLHVERVW